MTATNAMLAHRYGYGLGRGPRRMPSRMQTSLMGTENYGSYGSFDDAVAADMFGADDEDMEDAEADEDDAEDGGSDDGGEKKGFKLPKLPGWALPAAAIAAGTAGAVGLGLALTSKKRKAKKAAKEASEAFGAMGDLVADSMFGDPDDDDDDEFGVDLLWPLSGSSSPQPPPPSLPPLATVQPVSSGAPSWSQYKSAHRDLYRATKKSEKASERLAKAQSAIPPLSTPFGGMHRQRYGWNVPKIPSPLSFSSAQELQKFLGDLASQAPADLNWIATRLVVGELGLGTASSNQARFTAQFEKFKNAVLREGGMGSAATAEANAGVDLVGQVKGSSVSPLNRQAMLSVSKATAPFIVRGLA